MVVFVFTSVAKEAEMCYTICSKLRSEACYDYPRLPYPQPSADISLLFQAPPEAVCAGYDLRVPDRVHRPGVPAGVPRRHVLVAPPAAVPDVFHRYGRGGGRLSAAVGALFRGGLLGSHLRHPGGGGHPPRPVPPHSGAGLRFLRPQPHRPADEPVDQRPVRADGAGAPRAGGFCSSPP